MKICVLIVAAGKGLRAGGGERPKQYQDIGGRAVLSHTLDAFSAIAQISDIVTAINPEHRSYYEAALAQTCQAENLRSKIANPVAGGASRQQTVANGLAALNTLGASHVLIHDGARPFISAALIKRIIAALRDNTVVLPALPVTDTLKYVTDNVVQHTVDRAPLWAAQTPQAFDFDLIHQLHQQAISQNETSFTDDIALAEWQDHRVSIVEGQSSNTKITSADDLMLADLLMTLKESK